MENNEIFSKLNISELQQIIGIDTLNRLKNILPYLRGIKIKHPEDIYNKTNLTKILMSYVGADFLSKPASRIKIINRLPSEDIKELAKRLKIDPNLEFNKLIVKISKIKWGPNENTKIIIDFFKLSNNLIPPKYNLPNIQVIKKPVYRYKSLKDFQWDIYERSMKKLANPSTRLIIWMPTGSGKTRTAMEIICNFLNKNPNKSVIWLASSEELCEQATECFIEMWNHIGDFDIDVIRAWGNNGLLPLKRSSFIVGGFDKLYSQFKKNKESFKKINDDLLLIVVDEAHQAVAKTYEIVIKNLLGNNYETRLIGLTATPYRIEKSGREIKKLSDLFFNESPIQINSGDQSVFQYLRDKNILSKVNKDPLISNRIFELNDKEKAHIERYFDFPEGFLKKVAQDDIRNIEIIEKLKEECNHNKKILFFGATVEQSKFICATLNFLGYGAEHLDSNTSIDRRRDIINDFKTKNLNVLCNFGILTTGFDVPKIDTIFIARPTMSIVLYSQMIGRGLRGTENGGTKECKLIDVIDNIEAYKSPDNVYDSFEEYWKNDA